MDSSDATSRIDPPSHAPPTEESFPEPPTIREGQVQMAVKFLSHPKVIGSSVAHCRSFLEQKGLSKQEIDEAIRHAPDLASNGFADEAVSSEGRQIVSHGMQQNQIVSPHSLAVFPAQVVTQQPVGTMPLPLVQARIWPNWSHILFAIAFLTASASAAAAALVWKNILIRKFKAWIHKILKEEGYVEQGKPSIPDTTEAVRAVTAEVVKTTQEMLKSKNEERQEHHSFVKAFESEMQELKSSLKQLSASLNANRTEQELLKENVQLTNAHEHESSPVVS